jgi:hypothetical protein
MVTYLWTGIERDLQELRVVEDYLVFPCLP